MILLYTVKLQTVGHHVAFRTSLHMSIDMVMITVLPPLKIATREIKKMKSQIMIKFVSILSSPPKVGAEKFLGNLGAVKALLGMARM